MKSVLTQIAARRTVDDLRQTPAELLDDQAFRHLLVLHGLVGIVRYGQHALAGRLDDVVGDEVDGLLPETKV